MTFAAASSTTGSLDLSWEPFAADELHAWILLVDPSTLTPASLHPEALLRELIRVPLDARAGHARVFVPVDRALGLMLMARNDAGRPIPTPPLVVRSGAPVARVEAPPVVPEAPRAGAKIPLVFRRSNGVELTPPDISDLARRLQAQVPVPEPVATLKRFSFGALQRWTLTRLGFAPSELPRCAIVRTTFLDQTTLTTWEQAPPADAIALPPGTDGLVDAVTPEDTTAFYAVFERGERADGAWQSVPLILLNPPYSESRQPFVVGDAAARLAPLAARPVTSDAQASLFEAVLKVVR